MSHPKNKRDRFLRGKRKSYKRVFMWFSKPDKDLIERAAKKHRNVTKICSSLRCCGNPRRRGELTFQERKFFDSCQD